MKKHCLFFALLFCFFSSSAQIITTFAGNGIDGFSGDGGPATNAEFDSPSGVAVDKWGNIYIADWTNPVIHKIDTNGIMTRFAGNGTEGSSGDGGPATAAQLVLANPITAIAVDLTGNVFFA